MGSSLSKVPLTLFEILNEVYTAAGSGLVGLSVLVYHGVTTYHIFRTLSITAITVGSLVFFFQTSELCAPSKRKVIFITGCDSGLGFSLAQHAHEKGFSVLAACLNLNSKGAIELQRLFGAGIQQIELDITQDASVESAVRAVEDFLKNDPKYVLWAVINNAGVMVFGEFEWQTERLIQQQIEINLAGTMRVTRAFCPLLRKHKGRIITVTSHCAYSCLPGLAVYGATKAALAAWSDGLRVELGKYGIKVITFIPGSFTQHSNIMAKQVENVYEMRSAFTPEQLDFYGDYFKRYNAYLALLSAPSLPKKIDDSELYDVFEKTLLEITPKAKYVHEPFRYTVYHTLFKIMPTKIRDYLVCRFMKMPEYIPETPIVPESIS